MNARPLPTCKAAAAPVDDAPEALDVVGEGVLSLGEPDDEEGFVLDELVFSLISPPKPFTASGERLAGASLAAAAKAWIFRGPEALFTCQPYCYGQWRLGRAVTYGGLITPTIPF